MSTVKNLSAAQAHKSSKMLFPFDRRRRLAGYIVNNSINAPDLIYNPAGYDAQNLIRDLRKISGHKINGLNRTNGNDVFIASFIAHYPDR